MGFFNTEVLIILILESHTIPVLQRFVSDAANSEPLYSHLAMLLLKKNNFCPISSCLCLLGTKFFCRRQIYKNLQALQILC